MSTKALHSAWCRLLCLIDALLNPHMGIPMLMINKVQNYRNNYATRTEVEDWKQKKMQNISLRAKNKYHQYFEIVIEHSTLPIPMPTLCFSLQFDYTKMNHHSLIYLFATVIIVHKKWATQIIAGQHLVSKYYVSQKIRHNQKCWCLQPNLTLYVPFLFISSKLHRCSNDLEIIRQTCFHHNEVLWQLTTSYMLAVYLVLCVGTLR